MNKASIAIVIPVYNVENYIKKTLDSVKNQLSKPDEVIIINDGSTDNSAKIIKDYRNLNNWRIINKKNEGLGLTRNYGISITKSEYIYFLDSDDILKQDLIIRLREVIIKYNKPEMILFSGEFFNDGKHQNLKINLKFSLQGEFTRNSRLISKLSKKKEILPQAGRYLTKVNLWLNNNLNYPKGIAEDEAVFFPLLALSKKTIVIRKILYKYRVGRSDSITMSPLNPRHKKDYLKRIHDTIKFMKLNKNLIIKDIKAWNSRLEKKGINLVSFCLRTNNSIDWNVIFLIFLHTKKISFLIKVSWRLFKYLFLRK